MRDGLAITLTCGALTSTESKSELWASLLEQPSDHRARSVRQAKLPEGDFRNDSSTAPSTGTRNAIGIQIGSEP
jgi:hypothetical protein